MHQNIDLSHRFTTYFNKIRCIFVTEEIVKHTLYNFPYILIRVDFENCPVNR